VTKGNRMHHLSRFSTIAVFLSIAAVSATSLAAPEDPAKAQAQATLREGNAALEQGRAAEALAKFTEAYRLFPSPKIHYNLGQAHSLIPGHEAQAYEEMSRFLDAAIHADADLRAAAEKQRKQLRPKVGIVTVVAEPADADLIIDGVNGGKVSTEWPVILGIGTHRLALRKDAASSPVQTIAVVGGDSLEVRLQVLPPTPPPTLAPLTPVPTSNAVAALSAANNVQTGPAPAPPDYWTWRRKAGMGLAGLGVASLVLGIVEHVSYFGKANDFKNAGCGTSNLSVGPNCKSLDDQFNSAQTWFIVGYIGAAVLSGAGSYLLWVAPAESSKEGAGVVSVSSGMTVNYQGQF
jgi:tetratricopeptide (TPR) repeat protein